jgi:hypothetical protein
MSSTKETLGDHRGFSQHRSGGHLVDPGPAGDQVRRRNALQNPDASVGEIRDALLIEAGFPPLA